MGSGLMSARTLATERSPVSSPGPETADPLDLLFDPDHFLGQATLAAERLAGHLADHSLRGLALSDPTAIQAVAARLTRGGRVDDRSLHARKLGEIIDLYARTGIPVYSPGYMGRQFSGPLPVAAVVDLVSAVLTQPASFYEAAQLPSVVERIMAGELNHFLGFPADRFTMVTTSGGSLANLTALLAARNRRYPRAWAEGMAGLASRPAIAVGADAHYSFTRAAGILGLGEERIVRLPLDPARRIDPLAARAALDAAAARGLDVFCLVAAAGSTAIGAIDPLDALADLAAERGLWLHVDGAHGASLLLSERLRPRLGGLARADSLTWDAHKTLFMPAACTLLFYRDRDDALRAFHQEASYVFEQTPDLYTAYDAAEKNFECTKRPMIMPLWVAWALYGAEPFAAKLDLLCGLADTAHALLEAAPDFVPLHRPEANILCFRYLPAERLAPAALGRLQEEIRRHIRARGRFFISKVDLDGLAALRVVFMNHLITPDHLHLLLDEIRAVADAIRQGRTDHEEPTP